MIIAVLVGAPAAEAGTLSKTNGEYVYSESAADTSENVVLLYYCTGCDAADPGSYFLIRDVGHTIADGGHDCTVSSDPNFLKCPDTSVTRWRVSLTGGNDAAAVQEMPPGLPFLVPVTLDGGAGEDGLHGGAQGDQLIGGPDVDFLEGMGGDDLLDGGIGADVLNGQGGTDTASYAGRATGVFVDLARDGAEDGSAEDGAAGSRDEIDTVESVTGGGGADELRGNALANRLDGGPGDDTLNAFSGQDTVLGGAGVDNIQARDGAADSVDCGPDEDAATTDAIDSRVNCDPPPPDPPAPTIVTVTLPSRVLFDLSYTFTAGRRGTTLRNLATDVEPGARVTATCRTKRNKRCTRTRDLARTAASVRMRGFEGKRLPVGAKLTIRVTKEGRIGAVKTLTIRKRKAPSIRTLCIPPGATRPSAC
jgi:hypothetical protein